MDFGDALRELKAGKCIKRKEWDECSSSNMFVFLVNGSRFPATRPPLDGIYPTNTLIYYLPHMDICCNNVVSPWDVTYDALLANDWVIHTPTPPLTHYPTVTHQHRSPLPLLSNDGKDIQEEEESNCQDIESI